MRALGLLVLGLLMAALPAWAQSPDCRPQPGIPLQLDLSSLPGASSKGPTGTAMVVVPAGPPAGCARQPPHLPEDVLHGDPGDALSGDPPPARK